MGCPPGPGISSAQPPSLPPPLRQGEHVALLHGAFHLVDDAVARVIHEFHAHLRALSLGSGPAQHLGEPGKLDGLNPTGVHDGSLDLRPG